MKVGQLYEGKTFQLGAITPTLSVDNFRGQTKMKPLFPVIFPACFYSLHKKDLYNGGSPIIKIHASQQPEIEAKNIAQKISKNTGFCSFDGGVHKNYF